MISSGHGTWKFPFADVLATSAGRGWADLAAEVRTHPSGEIPPICSSQLEITLALSGDGKGYVHRRGDGTRQDTPVHEGVVWLCPAGVSENDIFISQPIDRVAHIYLSLSVFDSLSQVNRGPAIGPASIDYIAGLNDPLVEQMVRAIAGELDTETAAGRLLVESLSLALSARLAGSYCGTGRQTLDTETGHLDEHRLSRVLDFIRDEIEGDLSVERLAEVACLSKFHFSRAFSRATGKTPHAFVSSQRLINAKRLLGTTAMSIGEVALACGFSSHANFSRAFTRATGLAPGQYRLHRNDRLATQ